MDERRGTATHDALELVRVLVVAGIAAGVLVIGVGSRLAMLVLRLTSPDSVHGVTSDDGFVIGRVTLGGTYNLLLLGAGFGIIGAGIFGLVSPWLIGPRWFRRSTTAAAAAVVVGSMLLHDRGVDFTVLKPTWLAIGLFVALPGAFGAMIGGFVDRVARPGSWTTRGRRPWVVPLVLCACFPPVLFVVLIVTVVVFLGAALRASTPMAQWRRNLAYGLVVRGAWLSIAMLGLVAVIRDVQEIT